MITKEQAQALDGHTPGPWASHQDDEGTWAVIDSAGGFVTFAFPAECGLGGDTEANARLIAAAPDLLTTVIALYERVAVAGTIARNGKDTIATVLLLEIAAALADHERVVLTRDETSLGPRIMEFAAILKETTHD